MEIMSIPLRRTTTRDVLIWKEKKVTIIHGEICLSGGPNGGSYGD